MQEVVSSGPGYWLQAPVSVQMHLCGFGKLVKWEHDDLTAPYWRWYWNDRPGATICVDENTIPLGPDCVVLIPQNTPFATHTDQLVSHLYFHFTLGASRLVPTDRVLVQRPPRAELSQIQRLVRMLRQGESASNLTVGFAAQSLIASALARVPAEQWTGLKVDVRIERALRVLNEHLSEAPSNQLLARIVNLSVNSLLRRFRQATGMSPHQYLTRLRIGHACVMLRDTDATLEQIAEHSGFCDRFHLSRAFKRHLYTTPAGFRRRNRQQST